MYHVVSRRIFYVPNDKAWQVDVVKELIDVRDNKVDLDSWQKEEVVKCIYFLTTS